MKTRENALLTKSEMKMVGIALLLSLFTITCLNAQEILPTPSINAGIDLASAHNEPHQAYPALKNVPITKASFQGTKDYQDLNSFISANLKFPETAAISGRYGSLRASLEILANGRIGEVTILQSPGEVFNQVLFDLVKTMPRWNPALKGSVPVASRHVLQLEFRLQ